MHPADEEWKQGRMRHFLPEAQRGQFEFREYPVFEKEFSDAPVSNRWPEVMYYRLVSPWVLPDCPDRIVYLDPDIVVMNSVRTLWNIDTRNKPWKKSYVGKFGIYWKRFEVMTDSS